MLFCIYIDVMLYIMHWKNTTYYIEKIQFEVQTIFLVKEKMLLWSFSKRFHDKSWKLSRNLSHFVQYFQTQRCYPWHLIFRDLCYKIALFWEIIARQISENSHENYRSGIQLQNSRLSSFEGLLPKDYYLLNLFRSEILSPK